MVRKILMIATVILIAVSQHSSFAQYAPSVQSNDSQGVHMVDAGKTILLTGASIALTGVACFIGGAAMYDPNPDAPEMPMYPLFAMAGAAAGGIIALIGLPFYVYGKEKMDTYG